MSVQAIRFGNLSAIRPQQPVQAGKPPVNVATSFSTNFNNGELTPVVKRDGLAEKLDLFA